MTRRTIGWLWLALAVLAAPSRAAGPRSSPAWSPDGDWIAFAAETDAEPAPLDTAWIFEGKDAPAPANPRVGARKRHRLWATRASSDGGSVLLDESPGPIVPPCWRPDGKALAFGRVVPAADGHARFEVVRLEGNDRRILHQQTLDDPARDVPRLLGSPIAWSPDGRFLAVPRVHPAGLAILRAEGGAVVKSIEGGSLPAWAPIGGRLFYTVDAEAGRVRVECLEGNLGATRRLSIFESVNSPLLIARDGQSLLLMGRVSAAGVGLASSGRVEPYRVRAEDGQRDRLLPAAPIGPAPHDRGTVTALAQDRDGENVFSVVAQSGQPCQVLWLRPRERSVHKPFPVLDPSLPVCDLALSPNGETMAIRLADSSASGLLILCDLESMALTPIAPDDAGRDAWLSLLLETTRSILRDTLPPPILAGRVIDRAVAPPIPGEIDSSSDALARLGRLARTARSFAAVPGLGADEVAREEAQFLFDYLRADYPAALADVDRLASLEPTAGRRLKVVGLRGQVAAGLGDLDRARNAFAYLKAIEPTRTRRTIEETALGPVVSEAMTSDAGWADYALARIELLAKESAREEADARLDHPNPDAPAPGLGLDFDPPPPPGLFLRRPPIIPAPPR